MANESRKVRRSQSASGTSQSAAPNAPVLDPQAMMDPLSPQRLKGVLVRVGLPLLVVWGLGLFVFSASESTTGQWLSLGIPGVLTVAAAGLLFWLLRQASSARGVAGILSSAGTADERKAALAKLDANYKQGDAAATFARAQLLMQDSPREALEVLETINLTKVLGNVADEARGQRSMIHLMLNEVTAARDLVDGIVLSRHQDARSRAMLTAVTAEAWARSGQAKRAVDTLSLVDPSEEELTALRPQIYRAQAFAWAYSGDLKKAKQALKRLQGLEPRMLGSFIGKKCHPLLQKEAKKMLEQSGAIPRQMRVQRRM